MSSEASGALDHDLAGAQEKREPWRLRFRKPATEHGLGFGFAFRFVIAVVASLVFVVLMMAIGLFSDWQPGPWAFWLCSFVAVLILFFGEHIRSRAYERISEVADTYVELDVYGDRLPELVSTVRPDGSAAAAKGLAGRDEEARARPLGSWVKRATDVVVASILLVLLLPMFVAVFAAIKFDSRGPVLFRQRRFGEGGRVIAIYKFRTMSVAEDVPIVQASAKDRTTRVGRFLRTSAIDELPQLINVLRGDMSLVGPRPYSVGRREFLEANAKRHLVKPGLMGWAEVKGYGPGVEDPDILRKRLEADLYYVKHWSLWLDLKILLATPKVLLSRILGLH